MICLDEELEALAREGVLSEESSSRLVPIERRIVFSLHHELRALIYGGVLLLSGGVVLYLRENYDRIHPALLVALIAAAAAACYAFASSRRTRPLEPPGLTADYILLLGALLVSADLGFAEQKFGMLGSQWSLHLLFLAIFHSAGAYYFRSRILLAVAITSLASWVGLQNAGSMWSGLPLESSALAHRGLLCAGILLAWRFVNGRSGGWPEFQPVFSHFIANMAMISCLSLVGDREHEIEGLILILLLAAAALAYGVRTSQEAFAIYGVVYALVAMDVFLLGRRLRGDAVIAGYLLLSTSVAIIVLYQLHRRFRMES